jgi:hypothetical protein
MRRTRIIVPAALAALLALGVVAGTAAAARPRHEGETKQDAKKHSHKKAKAKAMAGMTAAEMAAMGHTDGDDRGFAALANGEQHGHGFTQAVSKEDRVVLARQMELARQTALRYPTVADAEAGGLHRAGPFSPGLGAHYINYAGAAGSPDGVMTDEAIGQPLAWMYDGTHPDSRVIGLFYGSTVKNPEGFAGPNDVWHVHKDVCIRPSATGIDSPLGADHDATKKQCDAVGGTLLKRTQYLLHTWVVPGWESPEGVYAHLSSAVTCDDGTYETIKDVTKVGTKTTICADGTE